MMHLPPDGVIHFEDVVVGTPMIFGNKRVTRDEIIAFATRFDPQPFHLDDEAARKSIVGGLFAAGMHTCAMMMRMLCDGFLLRAASLGSPGLDEVKWLKPVRPDDVLRVRITFTEKRRLASRPDVGVSRAEFDVLNQRNETVLATVSNQMFRLRHPATPDAQSSPPPSSRTREELRSLWDLDPATAPKPASLYFEDRVIGELTEIGSHTFDAGSIIEFAREFDPQPFHLDPEAGRRSLFGGHAASGWQTAATFICLFVRLRLEQEAHYKALGHPAVAYGPSPGFKNLRWLKPVLAGDTVTYRSRVSGKVDLKSRPERGLLVGEHQGRNQRGDLVFTYTSQILVERRNPLQNQSA